MTAGPGLFPYGVGHAVTRLIVRGCSLAAGERRGDAVEQLRDLSQDCSLVVAEHVVDRGVDEPAALAFLGREEATPVRGDLDEEPAPVGGVGRAAGEPEPFELTDRPADVLVGHAAC